MVDFTTRTIASNVTVIQPKGRLNMEAASGLRKQLQDIVEGGSSRIVVDLSASTLFLDTNSRPVLAKAQLQPGLKLEVHGAISGPANAPTITAVRTKIHAGRFEGVATAVFPGLHSFNAAMSDLKDPFGNIWWLQTHVEDVAAEIMEARGRQPEYAEAMKYMQDTLAAALR